jgi:hypothetical protein
MASSPHDALPRGDAASIPACGPSATKDIHENVEFMKQITESPVERR